MSRNYRSSYAEPFITVITENWRVIDFKLTYRLEHNCNPNSFFYAYSFFDQEIKKFWCPHCKKIASDFVTLFALLKHVNNKNQKFDGEPKDNK